MARERGGVSVPTFRDGSRLRRLIARSSSNPSSSAFFDGAALLVASNPFRKILRGWASPAREPRPDNGVRCTRPSPRGHRAGERTRTPDSRAAKAEGSELSSGAPSSAAPGKAGGVRNEFFLACAEGPPGANQLSLPRAEVRLAGPGTERFCDVEEHLRRQPRVGRNGRRPA